MKTADAGQAEEIRIARDVRVDQIGFVNELQKHLVDDLKTAVKSRMMGDEIGKVEGDFFDGALVEGYVVQAIDPAKLLKMYEAGDIKKAEFLSAIKVQNEPARKFLSGKQISQMSDKTQSPAQLRITRKKGVEPTLVDAVRGLGIALKDQSI